MAIDKNDILEALGLETTGVTNWLTPSLIGFGVGALVGAAVALLVAPKAGSELRDDLIDRGRRIMDKGKEQFNTMTTPPRSERPIT